MRDDPDPGTVSAGDHRGPGLGGTAAPVVPFEMTNETAILLCASMQRYLLEVERGHQPDDPSLAALRRRFGEMIWKLEVAAAWPRAVGKHSSAAVEPA
ncbi:MAG: hypothetical protein ACRDPG_07560 [Nocardioidaceae bacterium]